MNNNDFQKSFLNAVINEDINTEMLEDMIPVGELDATSVINVYQGDYRARLFDVLGESFETTWFVLGDEDFMKLGADYVRKNPSSFTNLLSYGESFPEYLSSHVKDITFIENLAKFEWSFWQLFHRADNPSQFLPQELGESIFSCELSFNDSFYLFNDSVKFSELWQMRKGDTDKTFSDIEGEEYLMLYKKGAIVQIQKLPKHIFRLFEVLVVEKSIGNSIEKLDESDYADPNDWALIFELISYISIPK